MKYLLCIDGSQQSKKALDILVALIKEDDSLIILHVDELLENYIISASPGGVVTAYDKQTLEKTNKQRKQKGVEILREYARMLKEKGYKAKEKPHLLWSDGKPRERILSVAKDYHVGMIVMGSRGMGMIKRAVLGSVSDYVVHHSRVPVLITK